jgi:hypothetical protein
MDEEVDKLEAAIVERLEPIRYSLKHTFNKGMYIREVFIPAAPVVHFIVSKIHLTEHHFMIAKGSAWVRVNDGEWEFLKAPYRGITKPNTRRVLLIQEDCIWRTYHAIPFLLRSDNDMEESKKLLMVDLIEDMIIEKRENKLLDTVKPKEALCHG